MFGVSGIFLSVPGNSRGPPIGFATQVRDDEHIHNFAIVVIQHRVGKLAHETTPDARSNHTTLLRCCDDAIECLRDGFPKHHGKSGPSRFVKARGFLDVARNEAIQAM